MTVVTVPHGVPDIEESTGQIGVVASSANLAWPLIDTVNHLLGYKKLGLIHHQTCETSMSGTGRFYTHRHPNTTYLTAEFYIENALTSQGGKQVIFTAGAGVPTVVPIYSNGWYGVDFPWNAGDTGFEEVTYEVINCNIRLISTWPLYRSDMDPAVDLTIAPIDSTYRRAGFNEHEFIITAGADDNIAGLAARIEDARANTLKQALSWSMPTSMITVPAPAAWTNPFDPAGHHFVHRSRLLRFGDASRDYRVFARTHWDGTGDPTDYYEWRIRSNVGSATVTNLGLGAGWLVPTWDDSTGDDLEIDCTADDRLIVEMRYVTSGATPDLYIDALSIIEVKV